MSNEYNNGCNDATTNDVPDIDAMLRLMESIPKPECDVIIMTSAVYEKLKQHRDVRYALPIAFQPIAFQPIDILGLPIEIYPTRTEVIDRWSKLILIEGKRAKLCLE